MSRFKKSIFKTLAKVNKTLLPSLGKKGVDLSKANKIQMLLIGWRYYITRNSL